MTTSELIVGDCGAVDGRLGIVRPGRGTDDDPGLDVAAVSGEDVVLDDDPGVIAFPWGIVDEVDTA
jgi:hypothetical protein